MGAPEGWEIAGGVMWCPVHHGIADECRSGPETCDMVDDPIKEGPCDLRDLAFRTVEA